MIKPLNTHYSFTTPASVHDEEALTALELAGRQAAKINEVVADQNALRDETENRLTEQDETIAVAIAEQNANIDHAITETIPATVKSDVESHIESGDFNKAISDYAGQLEARVDNMLNNVPEGSTLMDAEIIDSRVDLRGVTHPNMGHATREQVKELHQKCAQIVTVVNQLYDRNTVEPNYIMSGGNVVATTGYYLSDFIPVEYGKTYIFRRRLSSFGNANYISGFNANKEYVTRFNVAKVEDTIGQIKIDNADVVYIRYDFEKSDYNTAQFFEGSTFFENVYKKGYYKFLRSDVTVNADGVKNPLKIADVDFIEKSVNLLNPSTFTRDYFINQNGVIQEGGGVTYAYSDYIPVHAGEVYCLTRHRFITEYTIGCAYTVGKEYLSGLHGLLDETSSYYTFTIPEKCAYIRVNIMYDVDNMLTLNDYPNTFIPYSVTLSDPIGFNETQKQYIINTASVLFGKRITFNGDSICAGASGVRPYGKIIADKYGMSYQNIAVGGGTITANVYRDDNGAARHWVSRTIANMDASADYAIVEGGVNDSAIGVPLGTLTPDFNTNLDESTFYGAFESMCKQLITRFAGKKVGYIAVHQMSANYRASNDPSTSYYWAAKKCCEKWGVPFLDLNVSVPAFGLFPSGDTTLNTLRQQYTTNGDGWHPTEEGYKKYYVQKIVKWLESL